MLRLKELRSKRKISQQKLAMDLSILQASISKYEKGIAEPDINMLIRMANYFHVTVDYLLGRTDETSSYHSEMLSAEEINLLRECRNRIRRKQSALCWDWPQNDRHALKLNRVAERYRISNKAELGPYSMHIFILPYGKDK